MDNRTSCEIVKDLLPLYVDNVCSRESSSFVIQHLKECEECRTLEQRIRSSNIENAVNAEVYNVLSHHKKRERSAAWKAGAIIGGVFFTPIAILTIIVAAGEADFSLLMAVLAAMLFAASFTVVPLMSKKNRFARILLFGTASILLFEFFNCLIDGVSFASVAVPTIFGLSVPFLPLLIGKIPLPDTFIRKKSVTVICWDMLWFFLTLIVSSFPESENAPFREGMIVSAFLLVVVWSGYALIRFSNSNVGIISKVCASIITLGLWAAFISEFLHLFLNGALKYFESFFDISTWSLKSLASNGIMTIFSTILLFGAVFIITAITQKIITESQETDIF